MIYRAVVKILTIGTAALLALAPACATPVTLVLGTEVKLATTEPLSSKSNVKGDLVPLRVTEDVLVDGKIVIPAGTAAVGQIVDARAKGAMGMNGRLVLRPLYLQINGRTVRLTGVEQEKGSVSAGAVIGMVTLGTAAFTGRSASIPIGTPVTAAVEKDAMVDQ